MSKEIVIPPILPHASFSEDKEKSKFWFDPKKEIIDINEGWIYERKSRNKKGKKLRKYCEPLYGGWNRSSNDVTFWRPRTNDLVKCEAARWKAVQNYAKQTALLPPAFKLAVENSPFSCLKKTNDWPGIGWVIFERHEYSGIPSLSWNWAVRSEKDHIPVQPENYDWKQNIGDMYFYDEKRRKELRQRVDYFHRVFLMALEKRYSKEFEDDPLPKMKNLVINGRNYLVGTTEYRDRMKVIATPEQVTTEIVT